MFIQNVVAFTFCNALNISVVILMSRMSTSLNDRNNANF